MGPRGRRIALLLAALVALIGAVPLGIAIFGWNWTRPYLERAVEARTGRELDIAGDLEVDLGRHPLVVVHDLHFGNPEGLPREDMFTARRIALRFALWPLLRGVFRMEELELDGARLTLERTADGRGNWSLDEDPEPREAGERPLELPPSVRIADSRIDLLLPHRPALVFGLERASATRDERRVRLAARGSLSGQPLALEASLAGPPAVPGDGPTAVAVESRLGPTRIAAEGRIAAIAAFDGLDVELSLAGRSLDEIWKLTGMPLPESPPYRIHGRLRRAGEEIRLDGFEAQLGESDLAGDFAVRLGEGRRPRIVAEVVSRSLDLDDIEGFWGKPPAEEEQPEREARPAAGAAIFPDTPFDLAKLRAADADVRFRAARIQGRTLLENVHCNLSLDAGRLTLRPLSLGMAGGDLMTRAVIDARRAVPSFEAEMIIRGVDLARLLGELEVAQPAAGTFGGRAELASRGSSLRRMASELDGEVGVALSGGAVGKTALDLLAIDLGDALVEKWKGDEPTPIRCAVAVFDARDGVLETQTLLVESKNERFTAEGSIDLRRERIDLTIDQHPKDFSIGTLRTPIEIEGGLGYRKVRLQKEGLLKRGGAAVALGALIHPAAALLALIEPGDGEKPGACAAAIAEFEEVADRPRAPQRARRPAQRGG
jgi:uncharacterized protein involved in outer membrane biogenesis